MDLLPRYGTMMERLRCRDELDTLVGAWVGEFTAAEALERLDRAEVPSGLVNSVTDLFDDPQIKARENIVTLPNPLGGLVRTIGIVPKLSLTPGAIDHAGPVTVGEHNEEIYCGRLGLSRDELAALRARGIV
jgi:crotonobetainyl-CoA:carnitine CoA-transferase CaiB-like acyl-CoA transferase